VDFSLATTSILISQAELNADIVTKARKLIFIQVEESDISLERESDIIQDFLVVFSLN
jgi:hypothetical protein